MFGTFGGVDRESNQSKYNNSFLPRLHTKYNATRAARGLRKAQQKIQYFEKEENKNDCQPGQDLVPSVPFDFDRARIASGSAEAGQVQCQMIQAILYPELFSRLLCEKLTVTLTRLTHGKSDILGSYLPIFLYSHLLLTSFRHCNA